MMTKEQVEKRLIECEGLLELIREELETDPDCPKMNRYDQEYRVRIRLLRDILGLHCTH